MLPLISFNFFNDRYSCVDSSRKSPMDVATLANALVNLSPEQQQKMLGELLYPLVERLEPFFADKITGMLLEIEQTEILHLIESPEALKDKVEEAIDVLGDWIPEQEKMLEQEAYELQASFLKAKL
ncbi:hypothetical protein EUTSA_v10021769mg [Eutrema salsugineum]|uniref:PABC domain-containing protein n=1 Tax=Eutrema salsugineum TaxID=72664 RepID=V4LZK7_EUTSA|nr:hypothetical protein EUTSA_v10021769mg [Eutrema salsugineum]